MKGKSKVFIGIFAIITLIAMIATVLVSVLNNLGISTSFKQFGGLLSTDYASNVSIMTNTQTGASYATSTMGEIVVSGYRNGFCMKKGGALMGGTHTLYDSGSAYGKINSYVDVLYDNIILPFGSSGKDQDPAQYDFYYTKMTKLVERYKQSNSNFGNMNGRDHIYSTYEDEQYAFWNFTPNIEAPYGNPNRALYKALVGEVNSIVNNTNGDNAITELKNLKGSTKVSVTKTNAKIEVNGNTWKVGPFTLNNSAKEFFKLGMESITFTTNGSNKTITDFRIVDANGNDFVDSNGYSEYYGRSGDFYIVFNNEFNKNVHYNVKLNGLSALTYTTTANYWTNGSLQPVTTLYRTAQPHNLEYQNGYSELDGEYTLNIVKKSTSDNSELNNRQNALADATFEVKQWLNGKAANETPTAENNNVKSVKGESAAITFNNSNIIKTTSTSRDYYTIKEVASPEGYKTNGWTIGLTVNKTNDMKIDNVTLSYGNKSQTIQPGNELVVQVNSDNVAEKPSQLTAYGIGIEVTQGNITLTWRDPEIIGSYEMQIVKKDAKTGELLSGANFEIEDYNKATITRRTTDENGIATFTDEPIEINASNINNIDKYTITEAEFTGENEGKYTKLVGDIEVWVKKDPNSNPYKIEGVGDSNHTNYSNGFETTVEDENGDEVTVKVSLNDDKTQITVEVENKQAIKPFEFELQKQESINNTIFLKNTETTVIRRVYANNQVESEETIHTGIFDNANATFSDTVENVKVAGYYYEYEIHENKAAAGYKNIFKKVINGEEREIAYIKVKVTAESINNLSASYSIEKTEYGTDDDVNSIRRYVSNPTVNTSTRKVKFNIKNPKEDVDIKLELNKHAIGDINKHISGALYTVKKVDSDGIAVTDINSTIQNERFTTTNENTDLVAIESEYGETYYYKVEEISMPNANYTSKVTGAMVKLEVTRAGDVQASITKVQLIGSSRWVDFVGTVKDELEDEISITGPDANNKFTLNMTNRVWYYLEFKKFMETTYLSQVNGGDFIVEKITRGNNNQISTEQVYEGEFLHELYYDDAQPNATYEYYIQEVTPLTAMETGSTALNNDFENVKVHIQIKTDANGNIIKDTRYTKVVDIIGINGKTVTEAEKTALKSKVKFDFTSTGNRIGVGLIDTPVTVTNDKYKIRLIKIDRVTGEPLKDAEFRVITTANGNPDFVSYDADPDTAGTQNPVTDANGYAWINNLELVGQDLDQFKIYEESVGDDYEQIVGPWINVKVDLEGITSASQITKDKIHAELVGQNADNYEANGIIINDASVNIAKDGTIEIIVPNNPLDFDFVINKVDAFNDPIEPEGEDGAEFAVIENGTSGAIILPRQILPSGSVEVSSIKCKKNSEFTYRIDEYSAKGGYVNILEGYHIMLYGKVDASGVVKEIRNDDPDNYSHYEIVSEGLEGAEAQSVVEAAVNVEIKWVDGRRKVIVTVENPCGYKLRLRKEDTGSNNIGNKAVLEAKLGNATYTMNKARNYVTDVVKIGRNETQEWIIREVSVENPYYNILGNTKYVKVTTSLDETTKKVVVNDYGVYENNTLISRDNDIYKYVEVGIPVKEGKYYTIPVTIKNPTQYRLKVGKYESDGVTLMEGATITINNAVVIPNQNSNSTYEITSNMDLKTIRTLTIRETNTKANHINIIGNNRFLLIVLGLNPYGEISVINKVLYEIDNETHTPRAISDGGNIITEDGIDIDGIPYVGIKILNPIDYKFEISKVDTSDEENKIEGTPFVIRSPIIREQQGQYKDENKGEGVSLVSVDGRVIGKTTDEGIMDFTEKNVEINREYEYEILERVPSSYTYSSNVFSAYGYHIFVKVVVDSDGNISLGNYESGRKVEIRNNQNEKAEDVGDEKFYEYVTADLDTSTSKAVIKIKVKNPVKLNIQINKKISAEENIGLSGRSFSIYSGVTGKTTTVTTNTSGNIFIMEDPVDAGTYNYVIRENNPTGNDIVNPLEGHYVAFKVKVEGNGEASIVKENASDRGIYIYRGESVDTATLVDTKDKIYTYVGSPSVTTVNRVSTVSLNIYNPQKYFVKVLKKDIDTGKALNGVVFNATAYYVYKGNSSEIPLINANTQENINLTGLVTKNVNGEDGIIEINDILFDHEGTFRIKFEEQALEGYKQVGDIDVFYNVVINEGRFSIENVEVHTGDEFVDREITKLTNENNKLTVEVGVENEQIKGSYNLNLNKVNKNSLIKLDGAEVKITAIKDGKEIALYEANDDVESKNPIIPIENAKIVDGELLIQNIRIEGEETYNIKIEETGTPTNYLDLPNAIYLQVKTKVNEEGTRYVLDSVSEISEDKYNLVDVKNGEEDINVTIKNEQFDLALRKFISKVVSNEGTEQEEEVKIDSREPEVITDGLNSYTSETATYNHTKEPLRVEAGDTVIYTLRVYNEADRAGYAEVITDHLPEYIEFVDDEFNKSFGWTLDSSDSTNRTVVTNYLSRAKDAENNLIKAFDMETGDIDFKEVQIKCRIKGNAPVELKLTNIAEITSFVDENGKTVVDRDSQGGNVTLPEDKDLPNYKDEDIENKLSYIEGQQDDDDFEKVIIGKYDFSLRKFITKVISKEGTKSEREIEIESREPEVVTDKLKDKSAETAIYNHTKEPVKLKVGNTVIYTIRVYNEGDRDGYVKVVTDHLPDGLEFVDDEFNKAYGWTVDATGKVVTTNYLSKETNADNLLKAFDPESGKLDYRDIQIKCRVKAGVKVNTKLTNIAEITESTNKNGYDVVDRDSQGGNAQVPSGKDLENYKDKEIESGKQYIEGQQDDDDFEKVIIEEFDLALRKFITGVTNGYGEKTEVKSRIPVFKVDENGKYVYEHTKEPVLVANQNVVEYTIRVYNEGTVNGYASLIKDDIPEGLEFLPNEALNVEYRWVMLDENGKVTEDVSKAKFIVTDYLSKEQEKSEGSNLLKAFDVDAYEAGSIKEPNFKEVKVAFKVTIPNTSDKIVINQAQISEDTDEDGYEVDDIDSTPDKWIEGEDDQDIEKIKVQWFDLSLRKWVTKAIVIENGKETVTETGHKAEDNPEAVVKVDLKKSKIDDVVVKFEYQIRVKNESPIAGSVEEITDYIPEGLKFVKEDNPDWKEVSEGVVTTDKLSGKILQTEETAEVTIVLTWINKEDNMGLKVNIAEISKDYNEFGSPDKDSVPNNKVPGEDDIDDAPVMLTVKTGETIVYAGLVLAVLAIVAGGAYSVKKYVLK